MDITSSQVENIVRKILGEMGGSGKTTSTAIPKTAKVAMLTAERELK